MTDFKSLNLIAPILEALESKGYTTPTPIQAQAIPHLMEGKDLLGIAQTGTGKTAAFALPILNYLATNRVAAKPKSMRALILTPTRELASQIADNIKLYGKSLGLKHAVIFGGVGENPQITALMKGLDIVIATPGRLLDLTNQGYVKYDQLELFVLDEADRMLDMGFINDIRRIIRYLPDKRQTLLFSATMPKDIADLANSILRNPVRVEVTPASTTVDKIEQRVCFVEKGNKAPLLLHILQQPELTAALVFCRMKHGANKVEEYLQKNGVKAAAIHGNKTQGARERALKSFRDGEVKVLVATDIAARGIDIPLVSHVINFDLPQEAESYVHRIGRTARAGREGVAISFCDSLEHGLLKAVEKLIKKKIPVDEKHPFHGVAAVEVHRKISSGRTFSKAGGSEANADGVVRAAPRAAGARIFSARNAPAHAGADSAASARVIEGERSSDDRTARPRPSRDGEVRRDSGNRGEGRPQQRRSDSADSRGGSRGGSRDNRNGPRDGARSGSREGREGAGRNDSRNSRDGNFVPRDGNRDGNVAKSEGEFGARKPFVKRSSNPNARYIKATSKGGAFYANKQGNGNKGKKAGGIKSKIGKLVGWLSRKEK